MPATPSRDNNVVSQTPVAEDSAVPQILSELWARVTGPDWAGKDVIQEAHSLTGRLVAYLPEYATPQARRDATLLAQALERIAKGFWPSIPKVRVFLGECIRAVALRCGLSPFWSDEEVERLSSVEPILEVMPTVAEEALEDAADPQQRPIETTTSIQEPPTEPPPAAATESEVGTAESVGELLVEPEDVVEAPDDEDEGIESPAEKLASSPSLTTIAAADDVTIPFEERLVLILLDEPGQQPA